MTEWATQERDMQAADAIVDKHVDFNDGRPLDFVEMVVHHDQSEKVQLKIADWVQELAGHFSEQYGQPQGYEIVGKVLTRLMLRNEIIH